MRNNIRFFKGVNSFTWSYLALLSLFLAQVSFAYGFDPTGQPQRDVRTYVDKTIAANPTQRVSFGYDAVNQLTSELSNETPTPQLNRAASFDGMGNKTSSTSTTATNQYTNINAS